MARGLDVRQDVWVPPSGGIRWQRDGSWLIAESRTSTARYDAVVIAHNGKCAERITSTQPCAAVHALLRANFAASLPSKPKPGQASCACVPFIDHCSPCAAHLRGIAK
eukprot:4003826-Pleurochrysis_carterae.AAC.1